MSILKHFRKRRPQHRAVVQFTRPAIEDLRIARWHDLTWDEWAALPSLVKMCHRDEFYRAQGLAS